VPALDVPLVGGGRFVLGATPGERFDLIVFYRRLHCPICAKYLIELERLTRQNFYWYWRAGSILRAKRVHRAARWHAVLRRGANHALSRPQFQDLLAAIDFAIAKDYPARGEYAGEV
jgi:hypothetical protein